MRLLREETAQLTKIARAVGISETEIKELRLLEIRTAEERRVFDKVLSAFEQLKKDPPENQKIYERAIRSSIESLALSSRAREEEVATIKRLERLEQKEMEDIEKELKAKKPGAGDKS